MHLVLDRGEGEETEEQLRAYCQSSPDGAADEILALRAENARLRAELDELSRQANLTARSGPS